MGKNKRASFRVVVQEHTIAPGGKHVEILGSYDPHTKVNTFKKERIQYWISKGAQPSETAHNLFIKNGIIEGKKRITKIPKPKIAEAVAPAEAVAEVKTEEVKAEVPVVEEVNSPAGGEEPKVEEAKTEEVKVEEPKVEAPVVEEKKTEEKPA